MSMLQQLSRCMELIEAMQRQLRAGKLHRLQPLEQEYAGIMAQVREEIATNWLDDAAVIAMQRLEQQQRRLQKQLAIQMRDVTEKLAVVDDARKRLQTSQRIASAS